MKRLRIPGQILLLGVIIITMITLTFDLLEFYSSLNIQSWDYIHETLSLANVILFFLFLRTRPFFRETDVAVNLKNFLKLTAGLYIVIFISRQLLGPSFSQATFPQKPETISSLIYANIAALSSIVFLLPMLVIIRNLVYYKHKKRTGIYITIALVVTGICAILTVILQTPLNLEFQGNGIYNNVAFSLALLFLVILATRNSWITFLSRKEKYYYFFISAALVWVIIYVFDYAFEPAVPYHSLALGVFTNVSWLFLVFYSIFASFNLLLHLPTARVFDRKMKEVSSLHNLSRAISVEFDPKKVVQMVTEMSSEVIESSATWLEVFDEKEKELRVVSSKNLSSAELDYLNNSHNHSISDQIYNSKQTMVINDIVKNEEHRSLRKWKSDLGSLTGIPLSASNGQVFGILYAAKSSAFGFDPDDVNMLEAYANQASIALENAELLKRSLERERMEKELQIAREVQLRLLPQQNPVIKNLDIDTLTITAYEVGGDYYDFYGQTEDETGIIIGDVSGKGTSAAFYMAEAKGIIQSLARSYKSPRDMLIHTNHILYGSLERKSFISMLAVRVQMSKNIISFARAGHCPIIHYQAEVNKTAVIQSEGMAVGLDSGKIFDNLLKEQHINLKPNDILAFYTDGLSEARNQSDEEFGEERLCNTIKANAHLDMNQLKEAIIDDILRFLDGQNLHDDLTLVLLKIKNEE